MVLSYFIYLAALGLSCSMQDLSLQHAGSRARGLSCPSACGILVPWTGIVPRPLHWKVDLKNWTTREVLLFVFKTEIVKCHSHRNSTSFLEWALVVIMAADYPVRPWNSFRVSSLHDSTKPDIISYGWLKGEAKVHQAEFNPTQWDLFNICWI